MLMTTGFIKRSLFVMVALVSCVLPISTQALSEADRKAIFNEWPIYEDTDGNSCSTDSGLPVGNLPGGVPEPYNGIIGEAAAKFDADPSLVAAVFYWENRGFPDAEKTEWAISSAGASGPMQFLPSTWEAYKEDGDGDGTKNINDLEDALFGGARYVAANGGKTGTPLGMPDKPLAGNTLLRAAAQYNWGGGNVQNANGGNSEQATLDDLPTETADYVQAIYVLVSSGFTESPQSGGTTTIPPSGETGASVETSSSSTCTTKIPGTGKGDITDNTSVVIPGADKAIALAQEIAGYSPAKLQQICDGSPNCYQRCERLAGVVWGRASSGYATANQHWAAATDKHPGDRNVPPGALLYYDTGSVYGHVATYLGNNLVLSNDVGDAASGIKGGAYIVNTADMEGGTWNLKYLGWVNPVPW